MFRKKILVKFKFDAKYNILGDYDLMLNLSHHYDIQYFNIYSGIYNIHF